MLRNIIKKTVKFVLVKVPFLEKKAQYFLLKQQLDRNFKTDKRLYSTHSTVFKQDGFNKIETEIILQYHSIEKGLSHSKIRPKFGKQRIESLINLVNQDIVRENRERSQILAAHNVLCQYYEYHKSLGIDISDYYSDKNYTLFSGMCNKRINSVKTHTKESFLSNINSDFKNFSASRASVRDYTNEIIDDSIIEKVINLANSAPSACNRQSQKVYCVNDKQTVEKILEIQGGLTGYTDNINQLLVLTLNRNYFYSTGERNQLYVDGGIYLMNLLYSLHYYEIAACPAHWGMDISTDEKIGKIINLEEAEKVICLVVIGKPKENFKTTLSLRKSSKEVLVVI